MLLTSYRIGLVQFSWISGWGEENSTDVVLINLTGQHTTVQCANVRFNFTKYKQILNRDVFVS